MKSKNLTLASLFAGLLMFMNPTGSEACTRAVYLGPDNMVVTGRTMDWKEDPQSNLYLFPRGVQRRGAISDNTIQWTSKYGSVVTAGYDIGTCDGMNEKGLVANLLFLTESSYFRPDDNRPVMGLSIWTQYVLDNFATVDEAVAELSKEVFRIDDPDLPNGAKSTLHLSISDASGNSAIFEYLNGNLVIHEGRECQVMTNSPTYDKQLTLNDYWQQIGGLVMLPGTNRASDRFVRASFYIHAIPQTSNFREAVAGVFSVMRNVSVPLGITTPDQPNISSTRWRTVADQKNKVIHEGRECQVMTNSPTYDKQLTLNDYWQQIGGLVMLPGTNRASDRFVRASFYIHAIPQTSNFREAVAGVFSVMRNVSVPLGITTPDQPNISSTRWRTVADQKNKVYYFESTLSPDIFWVDFKSLDFKAGTPIKKLTLTDGEIYAGNTAKDFKDSKPLPFLFGI